ELCDYTHSKGMDFTSTPFDYASADYLEPMVDFYKISSSDLSNLPFIRHIAKKGKPVYMSVGASYISEVDEAVRILVEEGCPDIVLFHCVLSYPTNPSDANLRIIETLKRIFPNVRVGFSDHVAPDDTMMTLAAAYMLGAEVIEKHFTLDKTLPGNDHYHAGNPEDFRKAIANFKWIDTVLGSPEKTVLECEQVPRREARRSLVLTRDMKAGEILKKEDLMPKRPGTGISPQYTDIVIGRQIKRDSKEDTILTWDMV
ncbi:MAG: N-acetylneuraminate synthase family protein, partial [Tannerellaceae bacterium]|nr:N-acetylneuraminate synthase family protein [Tannerellaceae bacterium]